MKFVRRSLGFMALIANGVFNCYAIADEPVFIKTDVVYGHKDGLALTFDAHQPANQNGAAIIIMNSGGHQSPRFDLGGAYAKSGLREFDRHKPLLDAGYVVFDLRHGSNPRYSIPEVVADVHQGVRFIKQHADDFNVDPHRLGLWGSSAGGHLSLLIGLDPEVIESSKAIQSERVAAVVAMAPLTDLESLMSLYPRDGSAGPPGMDFGVERYPEFSPLLFASSDDPPTLLIHGSEDALVPLSQSQSMHSALQANGVITELFVIEGADHGLWFRDEIVPAALNWFELHLLRR
jgi:acetyl esterase/lipase